MKESLPHMLHATVLFHMLPWVANAKKISVPAAVQIRSVSSSQLLEGAIGTQKACQARALVWAGWLPNGKDRALAVQGCTRAKFRSGRVYLGEPEASARGSEHRARSCRGSTLRCALTNLHLPHPDRQIQPKGKASTKPRAVTFPEDGEHYACSTAVNRGIQIPDKGCLLLESYCKVVIQTHNWNTIYTIKTGTKALTWSTKKQLKTNPMLSCMQ